jgi:hypothetical protein
MRYSVARRVHFLSLTLLAVVLVSGAIDCVMAAALPKLFPAVAVDLTWPFGVRIQVADPRTFSSVIYATLLLFAAIGLLAARVFLAGTSVFPFSLLVGALLAFCLLWDVGLQLHVLQFANLLNHANNALTAVMSLSILITAFIVEPTIVSWLRIGFAAGCSFVAKLAALVTIIWCSDVLNGATLVLVMFLAYSFQVFSIHVMALSIVVASSQPARESILRRGQIIGVDRSVG